MSALEAVPSILDRADAERLTANIAGHLKSASRLLVQAYRGRAHEALGYGPAAAGWQAYVAERFGDIRGIRLEVPDRIELAAAMTLDGMKRAEVRRNLGVSLGTVQHDLEVAGVVDLDAKRAAREARRAADAPAPAVAMSKRDRVVQLVAERGAEGLTALELAQVTGWTGGSSTGTMTDVHRQRRVTRTEVYRDGYAAYVVPTP